MREVKGKMVIEKARLNLSLLARNHRLGFWVLLILLTAIILLFPVHLHYQYHPVQSLYIFGDKLPFFGALYFIWIALLVFLLFTKGGERKSHWEGLALVAIFALVFLGFWSIIAPNRGGDGLAIITTAKYIGAQGTLAPHPNIAYLDFPALQVLTSSICQITGLKIFDGVAVVLVFNALLLSALLYLLFSKTLKNPYLAVFGVLLLIQGNWTLSIASFFYPGYLGVILLTAFLVLLNRKEGAFLETWQDRLMAIILLTVATMTHFVSSMFFLFVLLGIYLVQWVSRHRLASGEVIQYQQRDTVSWSMMLLCLVIPLAWLAYWAITTFGSVAGYFPMLVENFREGKLLTYTLALGKANLGADVPLWAQITRWFWLIFIYAFGGILWLRSLFRLKRLSPVEKKEIGGLLGIILVAIIGVIVSSYIGEAQRLLLWGSPFIIAIILRFFLKLSSGIRRFAFILLPILFLVLSFPTFLAHNNRINTDAYYAYDFAAGEFVESNYGDELTVFTGIYARGPITCYNINAYYRQERDFLHQESESDLWQAMDKLVTDFGNSSGSIFVWSPKIMTPYQHLWGIEPTESYWQQLEQRLQKEGKIYNNGHIQIYEPR